MGRYYYAGGGRIELEEDGEHVAVDVSAAPRSIVAGLAGAKGSSSRPPGGVMVIAKSSLGSTELAQLQQSGALRPVFRRDRAMLVPLPEVRVEVDDELQRAAVGKVLQSRKGVVVSEASDERLVLAPASGDPLDALDLANDIYERAHPAASSVRFVQLVQRPEPKRGSG